MAVTAIRTLIIYIVLIVALRITGKRQIGELQPIELVVTLLISDLAAVPMQESGTPLLSGLIPIFVLVSLELILSALMMKSNTVARLISGNPLIVIQDGKLNQSTLKKLRLTVEDLMETLRQNGVFDIKEVEYAIAETNGKISLFKRPQDQSVTRGDLSVSLSEDGAPVPVVSDGKIVDWGLTLCSLDKAWVLKTIERKGFDLDSVLLMTADKNKRVCIIRKEG